LTFSVNHRLTISHMTVVHIHTTNRDISMELFCYICLWFSG